MPALQVKDFPPDLYEELRECAAQQDRNISQQTVRILREYLQAYRRVGGSFVEVALAPSRPLGASICSDCASSSDDLPGERGIRARIEKREKLFERIHALPQLGDSDDLPDSAELVRQMREERDYRLDFSLDANARGCDR